uniref:Uncharacterized protein n=1 Tax=Arundo donax TaxID=35708 RepID=A0A0A8ZI61_ARUDO
MFPSITPGKVPFEVVQNFIAYQTAALAVLRPPATDGLQASLQLEPAPRRRIRHLHIARSSAFLSLLSPGTVPDSGEPSSSS